MSPEALDNRLGRIEEKMETVAKISASLESIAEKIKYMDQVSKHRIGTIEQDLKVVQRDVDEMKKHCATQTAKCPAQKLVKFEWLVIGTLFTTAGGLIVALTTAYLQLKAMSTPPVAAAARTALSVIGG